jgi:DUF1680 family protein
VLPGAVSVTRSFQAGDVVELRLPLEPRFTAADSRIDAVRGCVAVERGPEVMCLESVDLVAAGLEGCSGDVGLAAVDTEVAPREVLGRTIVRLRMEPAPEASVWPYRRATADPDSGPSEPAFDLASDAVDVPLIPYHDWANRGPSTMRVWLPATT